MRAHLLLTTYYLLLTTYYLLLTQGMRAHIGMSAKLSVVDGIQIFHRVRVRVRVRG